MKLRGHLLLFSAWITLAVTASHPAYGTILDAGAEYRRELKVEGEGGALTTATTTVFLDDRFTGIALTDTQGAARPFSLLNLAGSQCSIHFDAAAGETLYLYPSANAPLPAPGRSIPKQPSLYGQNT